MIETDDPGGLQKGSGKEKSIIDDDEYQENNATACGLDDNTIDEKSGKRPRTNYKDPTNHTKLMNAINFMKSSHGSEGQQGRRDLKSVSKLFGLPYNTLRDNYLRYASHVRVTSEMTKFNFYVRATTGLVIKKRKSCSEKGQGDSSPSANTQKLLSNTVDNEAIANSHFDFQLFFPEAVALGTSSSPSHVPSVDLTLPSSSPHSHHSLPTPHSADPSVPFQLSPQAHLFETTPPEGVAHSPEGVALALDGGSAATQVNYPIDTIAQL